MIPITVRLANSNVDRHITRQLSDDFSFRSVERGGFAAANFALQSPIDVNDPLLASFTRVYVYDARTAEVLWEGRLEIPGRSASDQGEVWALAGIGPSAHVQERTAVLVYVDRDLNRWIRDPLVTNAAGATTTVGTDPSGVTTNPCIQCQFPQGQAINTGSRAQLAYTLLVGSGQTLGAFAYNWDGGKIDANYSLQSSTGVYPAYTAQPFSNTLTTAGAFQDSFVVTDFTAGHDHVSIRLIRGAGGALTVADDNTWGIFKDITVLGRRTTKDGTAFQSFTTSQSVFAHNVVEDLLGRLLPQFDGTNATVDTTSQAIDQLVYPDGVTPGQVLEDLLKIENDYTWAAWESNSAGKYRFEFKARPTTIRYEASVIDGFDSPAPSFEQYNRVAVRWIDTVGARRTTVRTQTIPEMDAAGIVREGAVDLGDEAGTLPNAEKAGDAFLAEHRYPPSRGTLTVARPILDLIAGRRLDPWQLKPGELIRIRGVEGSVDSLNASDRDGLTVFRIVSVTVNGHGIATLELDSFAPTEARIVADLATMRARRR